VKKGEQGHMVVYYGTAELEDRETGDPKVVPFLKYYKVFNVAQCEGLTVPVVDESAEEAEFLPVDQAEAIFNAMPQRPQVNFGGNRAYYSPSLDYVQMPVKESFDSPDTYYNTLFHELAHSTGHTDRLARKGVTEASYFGSHEYSKEELVAEMAASFLSAESGIESTLENSVAYLQSWMRALKNDKTMLVRAASMAQKASDFILSRQATAQAEPDKLAA
jgi:antirestriction protein ArdC